MQVVGEAGDGRAAVNLAREQSPDVVVMDVNMPLLDGVEATRIIAAELPRIKVIGLSVHAKQDMETRMREAGAVAYLDKSGPAEDLLDAIRKSVS
jgi:DNA-binding NarL/FixJ family response regulator